MPTPDEPTGKTCKLSLFYNRHEVKITRAEVVTVLQFTENLTGRQAADAVRGRLDWKYCLGLELDDEGSGFSVLSEFRSRLVADGMEAALLEVLLGHPITITKAA